MFICTVLFAFLFVSLLLCLYLLVCLLMFACHYLFCFGLFHLFLSVTWCFCLIYVYFILFFVLILVTVSFCLLCIVLLGFCYVSFCCVKSLCNSTEDVVLFGLSSSGLVRYDGFW